MEEIETFKLALGSLHPKLCNGVVTQHIHCIILDLSVRLVEASDDKKAGSYFRQIIGLAIRRGNDARLLGTCPRARPSMKFCIFFICTL